MTVVYTPQEVADMLKLKTTTIRSYIRNGKLRAAKFGREYRITEEELKKFIEAESK